MFDIKKVSIFNTLSAEEIKELSRYLLTETFAKKESVFPRVIPLSGSIS